MPPSPPVRMYPTCPQSAENPHGEAINAATSPQDGSERATGKDALLIQRQGSGARGGTWGTLKYGEGGGYDVVGFLAGLFSDNIPVDVPRHVSSPPPPTFPRSPASPPSPPSPTQSLNEPLYFTRHGHPVHSGTTIYADREFYVDADGDWWEPTPTGGWRCRWRRKRKQP
jgi:hypothetical protein